MNLKIKEEPFKRKSLSEGRDYGMGFSMLKYTPEEFIPLIPLTACKDYLNDIVHIEKYNSITGSIYGFNHKYCNYFENDSEHIYLAACAIEYKHGGKHSSYDAIKKKLQVPRRLLKVLHYFETRLGFTESQLTTCFKSTIGEQEVLVFKANRFWANEVFLISLYTLLIRYYCNFPTSNFTRKQLLMHKPLIKDDSYLFSESQRKTIIYKFKKFKDYKTHNYGFGFSSIGSVHNHGIISAIGVLFKNNKYVKV